MIRITLKRRWFSWPLVFSLIVGLCSAGPAPMVAWAQVSGGPGPAPLPAPVPLSSDELNQLVAPIALYPDSLVAQVLAASTYPSQVTDAARFLSLNPGLSGASLAAQVNVQAWDPSVKALTQFPTVLNQLNSNLSWTSSLGEAYYNQPTDVLAAVQVMRNRAVAAGTLTPTPQQNVITTGGTVVIQPVNPGVVYVPTYNPWLVYGAPLAVYPGYTVGDLLVAGVIGFGVGVLVSAFAFPWGWGYWGCNWHGRTVIYNNNVYVSHSNTFYGGSRGVAAWHGRPGYGPVGGYRTGAVAGRGVGGVAAGRPGAGGAYGSAGRPGAGGTYGSTGRPGAGGAYGSTGRPGVGGAYGSGRPAAGRNPGVQRVASNAYRGYGSSPVTGTSRSAFAGYAPGGEARAAAERGHSSFVGRAASAVRSVGHSIAHAGKH
jgi:hypothetical protein